MGWTKVSGANVITALSLASAYVVVQVARHGDFVTQIPTASELLLTLIVAPFVFLFLAVLAYLKPIR